MFISISLQYYTTKNIGRNTKNQHHQKIQDTILTSAVAGCITRRPVIDCISKKCKYYINFILYKGRVPKKKNGKIVPFSQTPLGPPPRFALFSKKKN